MAGFAVGFVGVNFSSGETRCKAIRLRDSDGSNCSRLTAPVRNYGGYSSRTAGASSHLCGDKEWQNWRTRQDSNL